MQVSFAKSHLYSVIFVAAFRKQPGASKIIEDYNEKQSRKMFFIKQAFEVHIVWYVICDTVFEESVNFVGKLIPSVDNLSFKIYLILSDVCFY